MFSTSTKRYARILIFIFLIIYLFGITYIAWVWGFDIQSIILGYTLILALSSLLVNIRLGIAIGISLPLIIILTGYYRPLLHTPTHNWHTCTLILSFITFIFWLSNTKIEKGLLKAHTYQQALIRERDNLKMALKEITELYRFAEFGKVSAGVFHDLINPLTSINLLINELSQKPHCQFPEIHEYLERALSASKRMQYFIDALHRQLCSDTHKIYFDPTKEIDETIAFLSYKIKKSKCEIKKNLRKNRRNIFGNQTSFYQVITNIISNALDASEVIPKEKRVIEITSLTKKNNFIIEIKDHGSGIKPELLSRIFEPFFTTKPQGQGMGLGLSNVKRILEKDFLGQILVSNNLEGGCLFTVIIPFTHHKTPTNSPQILECREHRDQ